MNIPRSSLEQDDIVNSLNYEGIAVIEVAVLPLSWQWQTACWLCHRLNSLAVMVVSQPQRIILHIIIVLHQRCLNCSECFQRHLMFYTCNYNIRVTHRNGAIKHIFYAWFRSTEGSSADCSLFILSLHALALHLAVKYYFKSFCVNLSTLALHTSVGCISLQNASRTALCYATNTIKWKHS